MLGERAMGQVQGHGIAEALFSLSALVPNEGFRPIPAYTSSDHPPGPNAWQES